jgi:hypothetical protein
MPILRECDKINNLGMSELILMMRMGEVESTTVPWIDPAALLSRAEISNALNSVTNAEQTALMKIARHYANVSIHFDAEKLVQEALRQVLNGRRAWPKSVPATVFLAGVIGSIAREWMSRSDSPYQEPDTGENKPAERGTLDKIDIMRIVALFDDSITQKIVRAMMDGTGLEQLPGLNSTEYEINRKKIRRRVEKLDRENLSGVIERALCAHAGPRREEREEPDPIDDIRASLDQLVAAHLASRSGNK